MVDARRHEGAARAMRRARLRLVASGVLVAASLALRAALAHFGQALFPWWRQLSRAVASAQAAVVGIVPFALWDIGVAVLVMVLLVSLVRMLRARRSLVPWLSHVALAGSLTFALFVGWALNHYAPPLATAIGLDVGASSVDELEDATRLYLTRAAELAPSVPREEDGTLSQQDFFELARIAGASYAPLAERHDVFRGSQAPVKALLLWGEPLLYSGHTGIFWAPTGESGVPLNCSRVDMGFIMCHEAAHRLGLASEQEANFAAFLACEASDDARLAYSGHYHAFAYCFNALYAADADRAVALVNELAEDETLNLGVYLVFVDRAANREHYASYEGSFKKVGTAVNDGYLRSFGEAEGVRSYGLVVDYFIAWSKTA